MNHTSKTIKVDRANLDEPAPLFRQYPGQHKPQPAYVELDEEGNVCAGYSAETGGTSLLVRLNRTIQWSVDTRVSGATLRGLLADGSDFLKLVESVHVGHETYSDGSNVRGKLTEQAESASEQIEMILGELDPSAMAQLWRSEDWLFSGCSLDDHWPAGKSLEVVVAELQVQANADGVTLTDDLSKALLDRAFHLAQRGALESETILGVVHLDALIDAGYPFDADELRDLRSLVDGRSGVEAVRQ